MVVRRAKSGEGELVLLGGLDVRVLEIQRGAQALAYLAAIVVGQRRLESAARGRSVTGAQSRPGLVRRRRTHP